MTSAADDFDRELAENRKLWDAYTAIHTKGSFYDVDRFRRDPADVRISPWEREEVGDVAGKTLLHVQCHFGLDTLSWARMGARVTGADFSEPAIAFARGLAEEVGQTEARFVVSDVYDLPLTLPGETFDVVYTSRGVVCWLPDIERWGEIVASFVKPGGIFYIHEAHPMLWALDDDIQRTPNDLHLTYSYWGGDTLTFPVDGSYADRTAKVDAEWEHGWNHSLGEIVTALARAGLRIEFLDEKQTVVWPVDWLVPREGGGYGFPPEQVGTMPLMYSLRARKDP